MKLTILDADTLGNDLDLSFLEVFGELNAFSDTPNELINERTNSSDILISNRPYYTAQTIQKLKTVKLICLTSTGYNQVDLDEAKKLNIAVCNVKSYSTSSVVQHTFSLLFYLMNQMPYWDNYIKSGEYQKYPAFTVLNREILEISGKTWGIIGMGEIGNGVAAAATAFGCKILHYSSSKNSKQSKYESVSLETLLTNCDIISIHAPITDKTQNLITHKELNLCKKNLFLINTGRGGIINEDDLANALNSGNILAAGLDVLTNEPPLLSNPLLQIKDSSRLIITPHIAWASTESRTRLLQEVKMNIESFIAGGTRNRLV